MKQLLLEGKRKLAGMTLLATLRSSDPCRGQIRERKRKSSPLGGQNTSMTLKVCMLKLKSFCSKHIMCLILFLNIAGRVIPNEDLDGEDL